MRGRAKITKSYFYANGGFSNPNFFRKQHGNSWTYYKILKEGTY